MILFLNELLAKLLKKDAQENPPTVSLRYVKADGRIVDIPSACALKYNRSKSTLVVRVPGGARSLKTFAIVECDGDEIFM